MTFFYSFDIIYTKIAMQEIVNNRFLQSKLFWRGKQIMLRLGCKCENLTKEQVLYNLLYIIRNNEGEKLEDLVCNFVRNYFKNEDEK